MQRGALVGYRGELRGGSLRPMLAATDERERTELASRESNGLTVTLFWSRSTNLVTVTVADAPNDDYFELVLGEHERALDVFHHPFAHAAARGLAA
jgi:hypothetical protein